MFGLIAHHADLGSVFLMGAVVLLAAASRRYFRATGRRVRELSIAPDKLL